MANGRIGGTLAFTIDGTAYDVRGNFEVSASSVKREGQAGQSGYQGYTEMPVVQGFKADLTTGDSLSMTTLEAITSSTMQVSLANGKTYVLTQGFFCSGTTINATEGRIACEFQGASMTEI
ncbi:phage tail tube protein [Beijerinckia sp. L45]|uniref:phage tail tube protein n=1 Tax=Beijerinckia sp. L45 TaxID=1641855 RepID=UPI00131E25F8|nr:phage tail tube protein [Beijerinckia sp. L45]